MRDGVPFRSLLPFFFLLFFRFSSYCVQNNRFSLNLLLTNHNFFVIMSIKGECDAAASLPLLTFIYTSTYFSPSDAHRGAAGFDISVGIAILCEGSAHLLFFDYVLYNEEKLRPCGVGRAFYFALCEVFR